MAFRLIPWKSIIRWLAKRHGFLDPIALISRLSSFGQPAEVTAPIELVRNAMLFHARGLMNARAIQHNLDWAWPYWVNRQFDPTDRSFLPRAFSVAHVNLTHRNWTAVGLPGCRAFPIVDPRGLATPLHDGWSLDAWLLRPGGDDLMPARCPEAAQELRLESDNIAVQTRVSDPLGSLETLTWVEPTGQGAVCRIRCSARDESGEPAWLAVGLRPFNPEGVSTIDRLKMSEDRTRWTVNRNVTVALSRPAERHVASVYAEGDVHLGMFDRPETHSVSCEAGMATAAALYALEEGAEREVTVSVDLSQDEQADPLLPKGRITPWAEALEGTCRAELPDERLEFLFDAAVRSLVLMSPGDAYPGPFTYRRFWFRDAALITGALLAAGLQQTARDVVQRWRGRQSAAGYFRSQQGEWDANGAVLWALWRMRQLTGSPPGREWRRPVVRAARWIQRKRTDPDSDELHAGLLPAGFSAEHLGNTDYYYWDDFWSVAGLRCAGRLCAEWGDEKRTLRFQAAADDLMHCIERSLERSRHVRRHVGMAASPHRRMDAGAVGSLVGGYPLALLEPQDQRLLGTTDYLLDHCMVKGAFFQDMIHSGLNAYLTLHIAQVLLRAGDARFLSLVQVVADLASDTGQWPEAVHPRTGGGCMGDGQHVWASAEWVMMLRNMFVREEAGRLLLGTGIPGDWRRPGERLSLGPTATPWGPVTVALTPEPDGQGARVSWEARWREDPPELVVAVPGMAVERPEAAASGSITVRPVE